ncbi:MAG: type II toxin-antitoxin system PemK/MazF family toxin [Verrucomicrobiota bacterium]
MPHLRQRLSARWTRRRRGVPERGEVWQVDFGTVAKVRPALVISVPYADADRALIGVIPHTTSTRGSQFEVVVGAGFLGEGAVPGAGHPGVSTQVFHASPGRPHSCTTSERGGCFAALARCH